MKSLYIVFAREIGRRLGIRMVISFFMEENKFAMFLMGGGSFVLV